MSITREQFALPVQGLLDELLCCIDLAFTTSRQDGEAPEYALNFESLEAWFWGEVQRRIDEYPASFDDCLGKFHSDYPDGIATLASDFNGDGEAYWLYQHELWCASISMCVLLHCEPNLPDYQERFVTVSCMVARHTEYLEMMRNAILTGIDIDMWKELIKKQNDKIQIAEFQEFALHCFHQAMEKVGYREGAIEYLQDGGIEGFLEAWQALPKAYTKGSEAPQKDGYFKNSLKDKKHYRAWLMRQAGSKQ